MRSAGARAFAPCPNPCTVGRFRLRGESHCSSLSRFGIPDQLSSQLATPKGLCLRKDEMSLAEVAVNNLRCVEHAELVLHPGAQPALLREWIRQDLVAGSDLSACQRAIVSYALLRTPYSLWRRALGRARQDKRAQPNAVMSVPTSADDRILEARLLHVEDLALEQDRLRPAVAALPGPRLGRRPGSMTSEHWV